MQMGKFKGISMRLLAWAALFVVSIQPAFATSHAPITFKDAFHKALNEGFAEGQLTDGISEVVGTVMKTDKPVLIEVTKIKSYEGGCGRLHTEMQISNPKDSNGVPMGDQIFVFEISICPDGNPPKDVVANKDADEINKNKLPPKLLAEQAKEPKKPVKSPTKAEKPVKSNQGK